MECTENNLDVIVRVLLYSMKSGYDMGCENAAASDASPHVGIGAKLTNLVAFPHHSRNTYQNIHSVFRPHTWTGSVCPPKRRRSCPAMGSYGTTKALLCIPIHHPRLKHFETAWFIREASAETPHNRSRILCAMFQHMQGTPA